MTKRLQSKYSVCKKLKSPYKNLWGVDKKKNCRSITNIKKRRVSSFGKLLDIKQSLKFFYPNIGEHLFKKNIKYSIKSPSKTIDKLVSILESRLDSVLFRSCLVNSFHEARQLINHKYITVNNSLVNNPSRKLKKGDIIKLNLKKFDELNFLKLLSSRSIPNYIELDLNTLTIILMIGYFSFAIFLNFLN
jgi:small subunit ribosomal protein S4